jgi:sarcosine oxidase subunit gamma
MFERRSALTQHLAAGGRDGAGGGRPLRISEVRGWNLLQLAAFAGGGPALHEALRPLTGAAAVPVAGRLQAYAAGKIFRTTDTQYWVLTSTAPLAAALASGVPASAGAALPLTHSRVRVALEGAAARAVLARGIAIDLHPAVFRIGDFAQTGLHHTGILLERSADHRYELYLPRTFAAFLWEWLVDAALPFGYQVQVETPPAPAPAPPTNLQGAAR